MSEQKSMNATIMVENNIRKHCRKFVVRINLAEF